MAGLRSRAIGPGARSWLTGVAGPRSRKRGPRIAERRKWSAGRRVPPLRKEERDARKTSHRACFADRPPGASQAPAPAGAPLPSLGAGNCNSQRGPARGRPNNTGDGARLIVIPGRERSERTRNPDTNTERVSGFRVRPCGPPRNDGLFDMGLGDAASTATRVTCGVWIPGPLASLASRNDGGGLART